MLRSFLGRLFLLGVPLFCACAGEVVPLGGELPLTSDDAGAAPTTRKALDAGPAVATDASALDGGKAPSDAEADVEIIDGGPADADDDADIDAGDASVFVCGSAVCGSDAYCHTFVSGIVMVDGGAGITNSCEPLPTSPGCSTNPTCASCGFSQCTGIGSGCSCSDTGGELRVTTYGI